MWNAVSRKFCLLQELTPGDHCFSSSKLPLLLPNVNAFTQFCSSMNTHLLAAVSFSCIQSPYISYIESCCGGEIGKDQINRYFFSTISYIIIYHIYYTIVF